MKECHFSKWAGQLGMHRTLAPVRDSYYWSYLKGRCGGLFEDLSYMSTRQDQARTTQGTIRASLHSRKIVGECLHELDHRLTHQQWVQLDPCGGGSTF